MPDDQHIQPQVEPNDRAQRLLSDVACVQRALAGDPDAVAEIADRMGVIARMLRSINALRSGRMTLQDLEDLAQDVAIRALAKLGKFKGHATLEEWLCRFAQFEYMNRLRRDGRRKSVVKVMDVPPEAATLPRLPSHVDAERIASCMSKLPDRLREVVVWKHFDDLSFASMGEISGLSPNTAKTRYYNAIAILKNCMLGAKEAL